jgi:N-succinyl-L-ornithine transcarbamylase
MEEHKTEHRPKVVLSWAPHPKAVAIFVMQLQMRFCNTSQGYELNPEITKFLIEYDQNKAFENADFIYTKNWSSYSDYGKITNSDPNWTVTAEKMKLTN